MAKKKKTVKVKKPNQVKAFFKNQQTHLAFGVFLVLFSIFLFTSFASFFSHWYQDQSQLVDFANRNLQVKNILGKIGAYISHFFIYNGYGIAAFIIPLLTLITGLFLILDIPLKKARKIAFWSILAMIWMSVSTALIFNKNALVSGINGYELNDFLQVYIGKIGVILLLSLLLLLFLIFKLKWQ
ncbi:MAG TPA: DNA translocase FtsK, partial [Flavobacteriia bacterium]|nr:DNA translocase FtsK [Flavobacteriia bacterium]